VAQQTLVRLVDDIDGKELKAGAGETVTFSLDGVSYEIDLGAKNASALRKAIAPYITAGRRVGGAARRARGAARTTRGATTRRDPAQTKAIREWAKSNGHNVSERGRISAEVVSAYEAAH
jgi:hypothetical protein